MKLIFSIICFFSSYFIGTQVASAQTYVPTSESKPFLIAQNDTKQNNEINAYDPFADYSEFENTAEEQENINFFQTGRFLTLGFLGGLKLFTLNMSNLYQPGPVFGGYLNYFFDLNFAIQFVLRASTHSIAVKTSKGEPFVGAVDFTSIGVDFKYFLDKDLFSKSFSWFQPYFFLGVFHSTMTLFATLTNQEGYAEDSGYGLNMGLGVEFQVLKKIHFGIQYAFKFVNLESESVNLSLNTGNDNRNTDFRPYGDWMNITMLLGVNF